MRLEFVRPYMLEKIKFEATQALADFQQKYKDKKISQLKKKIAKLEAA